MIDFWFVYVMCGVSNKFVFLYSVSGFVCFVGFLLSIFIFVLVMILLVKVLVKLVLLIILLWVVLIIIVDDFIMFNFVVVIWLCVLFVSG